MVQHQTTATIFCFWHNFYALPLPHVATITCR